MIFPALIPGLLWLGWPGPGWVVLAVLERA